MVVTNMAIATQRLSKCVPERYAVNKNRRPLVDNGFCYQRIRHGPTTTVLGHFKAVPARL
jgi:hypothetical protein